MIGIMGSDKLEPGPSCGRKRKHLDEDEVEVDIENENGSGRLAEIYIENEYEELDNDEDDEDGGRPQEREESEHRQTSDLFKGQEPATISQYDDIKITPFNLKEEQEEGEFDQAGNFIFRKSSPTDNENIDSWADSVDWKAVEQKERTESDHRRSKTRMEIDNEQTEPALDKLSCYKHMLRIMRPEETVQRAIRRLGSNIPKRRFNKTKSTSGQSGEEPGSNCDIAEAKRKLDSMIELTHQRLEDGDTDIYQKSYEDLEEAIN